MVDLVDTVNSRRSALLNASQPSFLIDKLHRVGVFVQPPAVDHLAVLGDDADRPVDGPHLARRIEQRALERARASTRPDVAEVRAAAAPFVVDPVAR